MFITPSKGDEKPSLDEAHLPPFQAKRRKVASDALSNPSGAHKHVNEH